jgi:AbrB family looped-hinge helix DNA binding protein
MAKVGKYRIVTIEGEIIGVRKVQDKGRVQIPKAIRDELELKDGDSAYWIKSPEGKFYIIKATRIE